MEALLKLFALTPQDAQMIPVGALFFLALWWLMARYVFKPYLALIEARERATTGAVDTSRDMLAQAAELRASYDQQLSSARLDAVKQKLVATSEAKKHAATVTEDAERQAQGALKSGREQIARDIEGVKTQSLRDAEGLSDLIVDKISSTSGSSVSGVH